jgi:hypothetical protein
VVGLALSRALGLQVVALLAARHGIAVQLRRGSPQGTVALVKLPKRIMESAVPAPSADTVGQRPPGDATSFTAARPHDEPPVEEWRARMQRAPRATSPATPFVTPLAASSVPAVRASEPGPEDAVPLPSRVPGRHLSHRPSPADMPAAEPAGPVDPMRPHLVQELLIRHELGKQRGQSEADRSGRRTPGPEDDVP